MPLTVISPPLLHRSPPSSPSTLSPTLPLLPTLLSLHPSTALTSSSSMSLPRSAASRSTSSPVCPSPHQQRLDPPPQAASSSLLGRSVISQASTLNHTGTRTSSSSHSHLWAPTPASPVEGASVCRRLGTQGAVGVSPNSLSSNSKERTQRRRPRRRTRSRACSSRWVRGSTA